MSDFNTFGDWIKFGNKAKEIQKDLDSLEEEIRGNLSSWTIKSLTQASYYLSKFRRKAEEELHSKINYDELDDETEQKLKEILPNVWGSKENS